ncbi:hypothetical protein OH76DRAFT_423626 [Lentinus brumalis]|uniref:Uncharacterized protein n=1 Tax=Lentinus brumalis TaxID=2498619 RepID=A0A371DWD7_9APHY|nr:hypothetical protein OH76DRAFT_423626 [Polyporus brumalis]
MIELRRSDYSLVMSCSSSSRELRVRHDGGLPIAFDVRADIAARPSPESGPCHALLETRKLRRYRPNTRSIASASVVERVSAIMDVCNFCNSRSFRHLLPAAWPSRHRFPIGGYAEKRIMDFLPPRRQAERLIVTRPFARRPFLLRHRCPGKCSAQRVRCYGEPTERRWMAKLWPRRRGGLWRGLVPDGSHMATVRPALRPFWRRRMGQPGEPRPS